MTSLTTALDILTLAGIYGLYACGLTLIFGVLEVLNLAHAPTFAFAAVAAMYLVTDRGLPLPAACIVAVLASGVIAVLVDRIAFRTLRYRGQTAWGKHIGPLMTSLAAATILQSLAQGWFGIDARNFPNKLLPAGSLAVGGVDVSFTSLLAVVVFIVAMVAMAGLLRYTRWGLEIRGVAERAETTALFGVDAERRIMEAMLLAGLLAGLAGIAWSLSFNIAGPATGEQLNIKGFALIVLGGMGSVPGAVIGALVIAATEVLGVLWLPSGMQELIVFAVFFLLLVFRPQGILGRPISRGAR